VEVIGVRIREVNVKITNVNVQLDMVDRIVVEVGWFSIVNRTKNRYWLIVKFS